eukprot:Tbor_TRINITY_DN6186_c0_g1::TRINITY_DN6186_c0_g1_i6::g.21603::m.21603
MNPADTPLTIEFVKGIVAIVMKAEIHMGMSSISMYLMDSIEKAPTIKSAGTVAELGIMVTKGNTNSRDSRNKVPTITAVRPVRAPALIPVSDSMYIVMVLEPMTAPSKVPHPSIFMQFRIMRLTIFLLLPPIPVLGMMALTVPKESKKSTNMKVNVTSQNLAVPIIPKLSFPNSRLSTLGING